MTTCRNGEQCDGRRVRVYATAHDSGGARGVAACDCVGVPYREAVNQTVAIKIIRNRIRSKAA